MSFRRQCASLAYSIGSAHSSPVTHPLLRHAAAPLAPEASWRLVLTARHGTCEAAAARDFILRTVAKGLQGIALRASAHSGGTAPVKDRVSVGVEVVLAFIATRYTAGDVAADRTIWAACRWACEEAMVDAGYRAATPASGVCRASARYARNGGTATRVAAALGVPGTAGHAARPGVRRPRPVEEVVSRDDVAQAVVAALASLSERQRLVVELAYGVGRLAGEDPVSQRDIARRSGITEGRVSQLLMAARGHLAVVAVAA